MEAADLFRQRLGRRPYCSDDLATEGLYRLPAAAALDRRVIQPNTLKRMTCVCFDVDRPGAALDWSDRNAPAPSLSVMNPANGHAHLIYLLHAPVAVSDAARLKPMQYLAAIQEGLRRRLDADRGYAGLVVKNPLHPHWVTRQWADDYGLHELADNVMLPTPYEMRRRVHDEDYAGLGRNCTLFEMARRRAYRLVRDYWRPGGDTAFDDAVMAMVEEVAAGVIANPLSSAEMRSIARSVAKWVWQRFTPEKFRAIQAARGSRKGASKRERLLPTVKAMAAEGRSQSEIARELGISQPTVLRWLRDHE